MERLVPTSFKITPSPQEMGTCTTPRPMIIAETVDGFKNVYVPDPDPAGRAQELRENAFQEVKYWMESGLLTQEHAYAISHMATQIIQDEEFPSWNV